MTANQLSPVSQETYKSFEDGSEISLIYRLDESWYSLAWEFTLYTE